MNIVFDASAIIALLANENGAKVVFSLFKDKQNACYIHSINICEVYYDIARRSDKARAVETIEKLLNSGLTVREDMNKTFWQKIGDIKADMVRISIADCCALALSDLLNAQFWTSDHHEMDKVVITGLYDIRFIR